MTILNNNKHNDDYTKILSRILDKMFSFECDYATYYSRNHLCLKETETNVFIVGFDFYITGFLSFISTLVLTSLNERVYEGKPFGWIVQNGKTFSIYSPVDGTILEHNKKILDTPDSLRHIKFPESWFIKFKIDNKNEMLKKLLHGNEAQIWYERTSQKLRGEIIKILRESHPKELVTQYDGGKLISSIIELLPPYERFRILNSLFSK